ncbi:hypothetical protein WMZ97_01345 [Lentibacillus sp. N15]|uniref:hypothetical protein n=1 Tax=Lentibacillus songyuanensis TaxID=3136161 RepID=UPI0031BAD09F
MKTMEVVKTPEFQRIPHFEEAHADPNPGRQLKKIKEAVPAFKKWFKTTGKASAFHSYDLVTVPWEVQYGLWRAKKSLSPFLWFKNRMFIVQWEAEGRTWTLLNEPTEADLSAETPYFAASVKKFGEFVSKKVVSKFHGTVEEYLKQAGLKPEDVDFITYDHLHTQDVRRWIGTTKPQADISPNEPIKPYFPNAKLIVQQKEWDILPHLHPLQTIWYQPEQFEDIPEDRLLFTEGDVLLGSGVMLMFTPGHTLGNHSLVVNTDTGIWVSSENGIAAECYAPAESGVRALRSYAKKTGFDVVINGNTLEETARQYNSMVQEKLVADPSKENPRLPQIFPSSEWSPRFPLIGPKPSFRQKKVAFGTIKRPKSVGDQE